MEFITGPSKCPVALSNLVKAFNCKYVQAGAAVVAVGFVGVKLKGWAARRAVAADRATFKKDIVYLYSFPRCDDLNILSPGCAKVETFLRLTKIPYVLIATMDTIVSPTGRLPCISFNDEVIADSQVIIQSLTEKLNVSLDKALTVEQKSNGVFAATSLEKSGWVHSERIGMVEYGKVIFPALLKEFGFGNFTANQMTGVFRKSIIKFLNAHGNGDVPTEQCDKEMTDMLQALEFSIKKNGFAVAEKPCTVDCVAYNTCVQIRGFAKLAGSSGASCKCFLFFNNSAVLQDYCSKMDGIVYPDKAALKTNVGRQEFF